MAEFILGRIKFVYQGTWTTGQNYVVDDVVTLGGKTYICIENHQASALFATDYNETAELSKWSIVSDGQVWTGDWLTEHYYNIGDLVKYGGLVYVCNTPHESATYVSPTYLGLEADQENWDIFATSFDWKGAWAPTTRYKINDIVVYGGVSYVANTKHISAPDEETVLNVTGGTWATGTATLTFATTSPAPFPVGSTITVASVNPSGYNGTHTVTASSTTSVSFSSTALGSWVSGGTITSVGRLEASAALWDTFNAGIDYKGEYDNNTVYYKLNDVVKYGADLWICTTPHASTDPFTNANWDIFVNGFQFENSWVGGTDYQIGDIVTYGGYSYVCKQNHSTTQTPSTATAYWDAYTTGFKFAGDWANNVSYLIGDVVRNHGYTYLALIDSPSITSEATDTLPSTDLLLPNTIAADTTGFVAGMTAIFDTTFGGITAGKTYYILASGLTETEFKISLTPNGTPVVLTATTGQTVGITVFAQPTNETYWTKLNSGFQWTDNPQTYTSVTTTNVTVTNGSASGAQYTVTRAGTVYTLTRTNNGSNYTTGDIVKILGSSVGGLSPINDITVTLTASAGAITGETHTGISSTWKTGVVYVLGDIAFFGANSYTCVQTHTSESGNRPDADTLGTYWNVLSAGAEAASLTTAGDTIYYGPNGPSRLPIGTDGQVLRVTDGYPAWKSYGIIQNLVYVGPEGVDLPYPQAGFSIDRPWASVRYACQQIEKGYLNPQSQLLILKNKQFILKEINNYLVYTYKVTTTGTTGGTSFTTTNTAGLSVNMPIRFTGTAGGVSVGTTYYVKTITANTSFTISLSPGGTIFSLSGSGSNTGNFYYDTTKTERDSGIVVDSVIFDIGHGGTQKSTESALAYFDSTGTSYITDNVGYELTQFVGALDYLAELLDNVLNKTAPTYNYQTLNSVSEIAEQDFDSSLIVEAGVIEKAAELVGIITGGLNGGTTSAIPAIITPDTTISIKTGTYNEILPINVPAYTALLGDELRSTVVQPKAGNPLLATVIPKTIKGFNHIKELIPDLIANNTITPTTGNTTEQIKTLLPGSVGSTVAASKLKASYDIVYSAVASGLGAEPQIVRTSPTGWGSSLTNTAYATTTGSNLTGATTGYNHAVTQIGQNYDFIVAEVLAYLALNYSSVYSAEGIDGPSKGYRDIAYVLDSILYDLTYGGNTQSLIAGSSYYSFYALNILSTEKAPFIDAFGRLKTIITQIVQKTAVTKTTTGSKANTLTQVTSGSAGSPAAGGFAQDRVQEIIDWITNGSGATTIAPYYGWASSSLQTAFTSLTDKLDNIKSDTTVWCQKFYQNVVFDLDLTARDAGLVTTAAAYDMLLGTNFNAIQAGRAFCRATESATRLRTTDEIKPTLGAINFMYYKAKQIAASGAVAQIQTTIDDINDFLDGGVEPPAITLPQPGLPEGTYTGLTGTVLSGGGNGSAAFTITRTTNDNGYYIYVAVPTTAGASYTTSSKIKILGTSIGGATPSNDIILNVTEVSSGGVINVTVSTAQAAVSLIESNRKFIIEDIISYIDDTYTSLTYDKVKTRRDTDYILDAVCFDLNYGGNWASQNAGMAYYSALYGAQIDTYVNTATLDAIDRISTTLQNVINNVTVSTSVNNTESQIYRTISGGSVAATQANALVDIVYNFVNSGLTSGAPTITVTTIATTDTFTSNSHGMKNGDIVIPQSTTNGLVSTIIGSGTPYFVVSSATNTFKLSNSYGGTALTTFTNGTGLSIALQKISMPDMGWVDSTSTTAYSTVTGSISTYQTQVITFINDNYPALTYNETYAKRDTFNVSLAAMIDMTLNTNFGAVQAGRAYNRSQDYKVQGYEKAATIGSLNYLETLIASTLSNAVYDSQVVEIDKSIYLTIDLLDNGSGETPEVNGTVSYNHSLGMVKGAEILRANIPFLANEMTAYLTETYSWEVTSTNASTDVLTTSSNHELLVDDPVKFSGTTFGGVNSAITYYVASVPNPNEFTLKTALGTNANTGEALSSTVQLSTVASGSMTVTYTYDIAGAQSDTTYFLEGIIYDLQYTGNYRSLRHAQVLLNSINGSQLSDMWYVRNACGVRNMTMTGLAGTLTNENVYGTKRPTAGAYTSLDPGFGPNDSNAWVNRRSTYMQNCSLFGTGCTGAKIDGAIHAGGNRSMVMNDYTTFLSDGIGVWCTGSNSLTELVSVFSYYGYAGYLAELGAKIRATNGNSSYGTYGVIAEGVDTYETPLYATLDNRANDAYITNVMTDGADEILRIEFANAGQNYSNASWTISGAGYNATAIGDEIRDYGVFETRMIDLDDGYGYGGDGYLTAANASQLSSTGYITIAASDQQLSPAYVGMRVLITAGTGAGQSAAILNYNNGSKVAKIYKESFTTLTATATTLGTDVITVASTATLYANMPIYFGSALANISANTLYYVKSISSATQFTISELSGGTTFDITSTVSGQTVSVYAAGWDNVIPGKTVVDALDLTSNYIIEPRITYTAPGYTATGRTLSSTATWQSITYGAGKFLAIPTGTAATTYSANGTSWSASGNLPSTSWIDVVYGGGEGASATAVVGGLGGIGAQLEAVIGTGTQAGQVIAVNVIEGGTGYLTKPTIEFVSGTGSSAVATPVILDGVIVGVTVDVNGSGYATVPTVNVRTDIVTEIIMNSWGKNYTSGPTVTISGGGATSQATVKAFGSNSLTDSILTNAGVSQLLVDDGGEGYTSTPTVTIVDPVAKFIAIPPTASGGTTKAAYQTSAGAAASSAWTASSGALPNGSYASIAYGGGYWIAVGGTATAVRTLDGDTWSSAGTIATTSGTWSSIAYGNGYFVAIPTGDSISAVSSSSGGTWSSGGTLPASTTWKSIAYGNGRFVALAATGRVAYSVNNGTNWTNAPSATGSTTSILSSSYTWNEVSYGQGLFFAVAQGTSVCATSPDGINWTVQAMSSSSNWKSIAFGNPSSTPIWAAISATSGQVGSSIRTGATAQGRAKVVQSTISEIRMIDPGSGYPHGDITATTTSTNVITTSDTTNLVNLQPIEFTGCDDGGLVTGQTYYVISSTIVTNTSFKVADSAANAALGTAVNLYTATGLSGTYKAGPILTQVDPNKSRTAATRVRLDVGALGNPSFSNRGTANTSATANVVGDGFSDLYQASSFINVRGLYSIPKAGANVEFASLPGQYYKLVSVTNQLGLAGEYTATFQVNPALSVLAAPLDGDLITTRLKYSQVRLTGHDFLYIGVGNFTSTNYPNVNISTAITANQTLATNGGRTFFTSTDQDGNFNVGNLFGVQQSTGTATLNASAFNLSGLQSLQLGTVAVGAGSAVITSFSTDPYFTANSDNILPTQKAIKSYITAQIGGGQSSLNVNTLTSGVIYVANNTISTTTNVQIKVTTKMNFIGGVDGSPVALTYFMQR